MTSSMSTIENKSHADPTLSSPFVLTPSISGSSNANITEPAPLALNSPPQTKRLTSVSSTNSISTPNNTNNSSWSLQMVTDICSPNVWVDSQAYLVLHIHSSTRASQSSLKIASPTNSAKNGYLHPSPLPVSELEAGVSSDNLKSSVTDAIYLNQCLNALGLSVVLDNMRSVLTQTASTRVVTSAGEERDADVSICVYSLAGRQCPLSVTNIVDVEAVKLYDFLCKMMEKTAVPPRIDVLGEFFVELSMDSCATSLRTNAQQAAATAGAKGYLHPQSPAPRRPSLAHTPPLHSLVSPSPALRTHRAMLSPGDADRTDRSRRSSLLMDDRDKFQDRDRLSWNSISASENTGDHSLSEPATSQRIVERPVLLSGNTNFTTLQAAAPIAFSFNPTCTNNLLAATANTANTSAASNANFSPDLDLPRKQARHAAYDTSPRPHSAGSATSSSAERNSGVPLLGGGVPSVNGANSTTGSTSLSHSNSNPNFVANAPAIGTDRTPRSSMAVTPISLSSLPQPGSVTPSFAQYTARSMAEGYLSPRMRMMRNTTLVAYSSKVEQLCNSSSTNGNNTTGCSGGSSGRYSQRARVSQSSFCDSSESGFIVGNANSLIAPLSASRATTPCEPSRPSSASAALLSPPQPIPMNDINPVLRQSQATPNLPASLPLASPMQLSITPAAREEPKREEKDATDVYATPQKRHSVFGHAAGAHVPNSASTSAPAYSLLSPTLFCVDNFTDSDVYPQLFLHPFVLSSPMLSNLLFSSSLARSRDRASQQAGGSSGKSADQEEATRASRPPSRSRRTHALVQGHSNSNPSAGSLAETSAALKASKAAAAVPALPLTEIESVDAAADECVDALAMLYQYNCLDYARYVTWARTIFSVDSEVIANGGSIFSQIANYLTFSRGIVGNSDFTSTTISEENISPTASDSTHSPKSAVKSSNIPPLNTDGGSFSGSNRSRMKPSFRPCLSTKHEVDGVEQDLDGDNVDNLDAISEHTTPPRGSAGSSQASPMASAGKGFPGANLRLNLGGVSSETQGSFAKAGPRAGGLSIQLDTLAPADGSASHPGTSASVPLPSLAFPAKKLLLVTGSPSGDESDDEGASPYVPADADTPVHGHESATGLQSEESVGSLRPFARSLCLSNDMSNAAGPTHHRNQEAAHSRGTAPVLGTSVSTHSHRREGWNAGRKLGDERQLGISVDLAADASDSEDEHPTLSLANSNLSAPTNGGFSVGVPGGAGLRLGVLGDESEDEDESETNLSSLAVHFPAFADKLPALGTNDARYSGPSVRPPPSVRSSNLLIDQSESEEDDDGFMRDTEDDDKFGGEEKRNWRVPAFRNRLDQSPEHSSEEEEELGEWPPHTPAHSHSALSGMVSTRNSTRRGGFFRSDSPPKKSPSSSVPKSTRNRASSNAGDSAEHTGYGGDLSDGFACISDSSTKLQLASVMAFKARALKLIQEIQGGNLDEESRSAFESYEGYLNPQANEDSGCVVNERVKSLSVYMVSTDGDGNNISLTSDLKAIYQRRVSFKKKYGFLPYTNNSNMINAISNSNSCNPGCEAPVNAAIMSLPLLGMGPVRVPPELNLYKEEKLRFYTSRITPLTSFLCVSSEVAACSLELLRLHGITHIVNCAGDISPNAHPAHFKYLKLHLLDSSAEDITSVLYDIFDFIFTAITQSPHHKVLIHCQQGISRSTVACIATLMTMLHCSYDHAYILTRLRRGICRPNLGFQCQLMAWHKRLAATHAGESVSALSSPTASSSAIGSPSNRASPALNVSTATMTTANATKAPVTLALPSLASVTIPAITVTPPEDDESTPVTTAIDAANAIKPAASPRMLAWRPQPALYSVGPHSVRDQHRYVCSLLESTLRSTTLYSTGVYVLCGPTRSIIAIGEDVLAAHYVREYMRFLHTRFVADVAAQPSQAPSDAFTEDILREWTENTAFQPFLDKFGNMHLRDLLFDARVNSPYDIRELRSQAQTLGMSAPSQASISLSNSNAYARHPFDLRRALVAALVHIRRMSMHEGASGLTSIIVLRKHTTQSTLTAVCTPPQWNDVLAVPDPQATANINSNPNSNANANASSASATPSPRPRYALPAAISLSATTRIAATPVSQSPPISPGGSSLPAAPAQTLSFLEDMPVVTPSPTPPNYIPLQWPSSYYQSGPSAAVAVAAIAADMLQSGISALSCAQDAFTITPTSDIGEGVGAGVKVAVTLDSYVSASVLAWANVMHSADAEVLFWSHAVSVGAGAGQDSEDPGCSCEDVGVECCCHVRLQDEPAEAFAARFLALAERRGWYVAAPPAPAPQPAAGLSGAATARKPRQEEEEGGVSAYLQLATLFPEAEVPAGPGLMTALLANPLAAHILTLALVTVLPALTPVAPICVVAKALCCPAPAQASDLLALFTASHTSPVLMVGPSLLTHCPPPSRVAIDSVCLATEDKLTPSATATPNKDFITTQTLPSASQPSVRCRVPLSLVATMQHAHRLCPCLCLAPAPLAQQRDYASTAQQTSQNVENTLTAPPAAKNTGLPSLSSILASQTPTTPPAVISAARTAAGLSAATPGGPICTCGCGGEGGCLRHLNLGTHPYSCRFAPTRDSYALNIYPCCYYLTPAQLKALMPVNAPLSTTVTSGTLSASTSPSAAATATTSTSIRINGLIGYVPSYVERHLAPAAAKAFTTTHSYTETHIDTLLHRSSQPRTSTNTPTMATTSLSSPPSQDAIQLMYSEFAREHGADVVTEVSSTSSPTHTLAETVFTRQTSGRARMDVHALELPAANGVTRSQDAEEKDSVDDEEAAEAPYPLRRIRTVDSVGVRSDSAQSTDSGTTSDREGLNRARLRRLSQIETTINGLRRDDDTDNVAEEEEDAESQYSSDSGGSHPKKLGFGPESLISPPDPMASRKSGESEWNAVLRARAGFEALALNDDGECRAPGTRRAAPAISLAHTGEEDSYRREQEWYRANYVLYRMPELWEPLSMFDGDDLVDDGAFLLCVWEDRSSDDEDEDDMGEEQENVRGPIYVRNRVRVPVRVHLWVGDEYLQDGRIVSDASCARAALRRSRGQVDISDLANGEGWEQRREDASACILALFCEMLGVTRQEMEDAGSVVVTEIPFEETNRLWRYFVDG